MQLTICCHPKLMARIYNIRLKQCLRNHVRNSRGLYPHTFLLPLEVMLNINSNIHINISAYKSSPSLKLINSQPATNSLTNFLQQ